MKTVSNGFRVWWDGFVQKVGQLAEPALEDDNPVSTEREARKTLSVFDIGNNAPWTGAD